MNKKNNNSNEPLIVVVKNAYPSIRKFLVFAFVIALSLSPMVENSAYKIAVISALGVSLLFLFFDIYGELNGKLSKIEGLLTYGEPPYYEEFSAAENEINKTILDLLVESNEIELCFLTVSASYSWRFFEDVVRHINDRFQKDKKKIIVSIGLVHPDHFDKWKLDNWKRKALVTLDDIKVFKEKYNDEIETSQIKIDVFLFDNIPHWHGLLINGSILYLGRTEWEFPNPQRNEISNLLVGQIEYRKFTKNDRFDGEKRINRFESWIKRYQIRHNEIRQNGKPNQIYP